MFKYGQLRDGNNVWQHRDRDNVQCRDENTVDLVKFACLDFREFVILGLPQSPIIRELSISIIGRVIIIKISRDS